LDPIVATETPKIDKPKIFEVDDNSSVPLLRKKSVTNQVDNLVQQQPKRPISKAFGRISKFKHLKGDVILKGRFENLKNLSRTMPAECNFVQG